MKLDCLTRIGSFVVTLVAAGICLFPCTPALAQSDTTLVQTAVALTASGTDDDARQGRVTLTALVSLTDGGAVPDGTIEFIDVDTNRLVGRTSAAQARITVDRLPAGPHVFRADYSGVMRYFPFVIDPSRSATVAYAVRTVPSVSLSSSQNPSLPGEVVTLTAAVTDKSGVPAGSVHFMMAIPSSPGMSRWTVMALRRSRHRRFWMARVPLSRAIAAMPATPRPFRSTWRRMSVRSNSQRTDCLIVGHDPLVASPIDDRRDQARVPLNGKLPIGPIPISPEMASPSTLPVNSSVSGIGLVIEIFQATSLPFTVPSKISPELPSADCVPVSVLPELCNANAALRSPIGVLMVMFQFPSTDMLLLHLAVASA